MSSSRIEPSAVVQAVEEYVDGEMRDFRKYVNREPFDASGVFSLHALAARIYANGFEDGERSEAEKTRRARQREFDAAPGHSRTDSAGGAE